jgi:hypothetical protein
MPVSDRDPEQILDILRGADIDPEQLAREREPERCRRCGCLLAADTSRGHLIYMCFDCEDPTEL